MNSRLPIVLSIALAATSCDKAKSLVGKATTTVKEKITAVSSGKPAGANKPAAAPVDPALQKLVDQTAEGTMFRKDLPFPTRLEVRTTVRQELSGRSTQSSAFGKQASALNGTQTTKIKLERDGNQVTYVLEQSGSELPAAANPAKDKKAAASPVAVPPPPAPPVIFRKTGKAWGADNRVDFRAAALAKDLSPVFEQLLIDNALASRPLWFSKHRFKIGDELVVEGQFLPLLVAGNAKGSFKLKLAAFESVEGHPCGVFAVTGDYNRQQIPDFEGTFSDEEVTIQSGKLWLSLIYPVILKEELDTIKTIKSGGHGGLAARGQGSFKIAVTRAWKSREP